MNLKTGILVVGFSIFLSCLMAFGLIKFYMPKTAYVNLTQVYDGFTMKRGLEEKLNKIKSLRKNEIDSLALIVSKQVEYFQNHSGKNQNYAVIIDDNKKILSEKEADYNEEIQKISQEYQEQIWQQLNTYIKEFGSKHDYEIIYGTDGQGSLMYANEKLNISQEVIDFINNRFNGGKF